MMGARPPDVGRGLCDATRRCHRCDLEGHLAQNCPQKNTTTNDGSKTTRRGWEQDQQDLGAMLQLWKAGPHLHALPPKGLRHAGQGLGLRHIAGHGLLSDYGTC